MKLTTSLLTLGAFAMIGSANAATIAWSSALAPVTGTAGNTLAPGLFDTSGTQFLAENTGGAATLFDGINFDAGGFNFGSVFAGFHAVTELSKTGSYTTSGAGTITLTGLTSGQAYRIQALVYDGRGAQSGRTVKFDGVDQGQYANGVTNVTWGDGLLMTGEFTADASDQAFTIQAFLGSGGDIGPQLNAIYVTTVPEPSSAALLGLAGFALILRRRK